MNELVVRKLKDQHNPRGNWQSKEFFLNTVSKNVFLFDAVKKKVRDTSSKFALDPLIYIIPIKLLENIADQ